MSIYSKKPTVDVSFASGVFCLAGANGLGKSTFLAALNYAITGIVPDPERKFESVPEYYAYSKDFADNYFDGRVNDADREAAEVTVEFVVGSKSFALTRGIFERDSLRSLLITDSKSGDVLLNGAKLTPRHREERYASALAREAGLTSFDQFVFLQHFVFTFDERRHLLFWDQRVLEQVLYLCVGINSADAHRADTLRRDIEKADSLVRNYQWQATALTDKLKQLEEVVESDVAADRAYRLAVEHRDLLRERDAATSAVIKAQERKQDVELSFAQLTGQVATLTSEYEEAFQEYFSARQAPRSHPLVAAALDKAQCGICGAAGDDVRSAVDRKLQSNICPFCQSPVVEKAKAPEALKKIDKELAGAREKLRNAGERVQRLAAELKTFDEMALKIASRVDRFEREHSSVLNLAEVKNPTALHRTITGYREQIESLLKKKETQRERREEKKKELRQYQKDLVKQYADAEEVFLPAFRNLAQSFLGLDLDVHIDTKASGVSLILTVTDTARREQYQLSESQRFFVDIALRMALIELTSREERTACLLIDTPEGALDIAYESRAGEMFADFVLHGFNIILTANINTSRLLLNLARLCGNKHMHLSRMTSWTELSEVQTQEEHLFIEALSAIEAAMNTVPSPQKRVHA
jgi:DNA repair exonuclease SbcCD ATPase subunit